MSTDYQTYSQTYPTNAGFPVPHMVTMGSCSPMFQPLPVPGPVPPMFMPVTQMPCAGFQGIPMTTTPTAPNTILPLLPGCSSLDSLALSDQMSSLTMGMGKNSLPATPPDSLSLPTYPSLPSNDYGIPMCSVGSLETYPRSPSPNGYPCPSPNGYNMMPSYSPQPYPLLPPMISLMPTTPQPLPGMHARTNSVTITNPPADPVLPEIMTSDPNLLGYRGNSIPRSRSPTPTRSVSRGRSLSDCSAGSDTERDYERVEPSKRELVNRAFAKLEAMFGQNFDQNGNRGENILRLKVKTRTALEKIVPFIEFCQRENLIVSVSCPISTKKGRQQVRGFLAYLQMKDERDADRVEELIQAYNASNGSPFNTWHRNPPSTWKNKA